MTDSGPVYSANELPEYLKVKQTYCLNLRWTAYNYRFLDALGEASWTLFAELVTQ